MQDRAQTAIPIHYQVKRLSESIDLAREVFLTVKEAYSEDGVMVFLSDHVTVLDDVPHHDDVLPQLHLCLIVDYLLFVT